MGQGLLMKKLLLNFQDKKELVSIRRDGIDENRIQGFVLSFSDELVLLQYVYDFNLDGLMVLRLSDITKIESDKTDVFQTQILKDEGLYSQIDFEKKYDVNNWHTVFSSIGSKPGLVIVENETQSDSSDETFILGKIDKIDQDSVSILGFSGAANWYEESSKMRYKDISSAQVNNKYMNMYQRYFDKNSSDTL